MITKEGVLKAIENKVITKFWDNIYEIELRELNIALYQIELSNFNIKKVLLLSKWNNEIWY